MPSIIVVTRLMLGSRVGIWIQRLCLLFVNTISNDLVWLSFRISTCEDAFVTLYKSLVKCHLEYANSLTDKGKMSIIMLTSTWNDRKTA